LPDVKRGLNDLPACVLCVEPSLTISNPQIDRFLGALEFSLRTNSRQAA